jgi:diguanylate cyclase
VLIEDSIGTLAILNGLRSLGVRLAIDDFGTGYSSLSYLKRFPVDRVKIDRSFVAGLALDASSTSLVRAIVAMAEALDLEPVAEGVENRLQVETLARLGCTSMQGFLLGRPMSPHDAAAIERVNGQRADAQSPIECERTRIRS